MISIEEVNCTVILVMVKLDVAGDAVIDTEVLVDDSRVLLILGSTEVVAFSTGVVDSMTLLILDSTEVVAFTTGVVDSRALLILGSTEVVAFSTGVVDSRALLILDSNEVVAFSICVVVGCIDTDVVGVISELDSIGKLLVSVSSSKSEDGSSSTVAVGSIKKFVINDAVCCSMSKDAVSCAVT